MSETIWTDVLWTDIVGRSRVIRCSSEAAADGGLRVTKGDVLAGFGGAPGPGTEELTLVPDPATRRSLPWDPAIDLVIADIHDVSGPSELCARSLLRSATREAANDGCEVTAAVELEFYLVDPQTGLPVYDYIDNYNLSRVECEPVMASIRNELRAMGVVIEASNPEYSGGQFEVNIRHAPAVAAADQAILLRAMTGLLSRRHGYDATFLAKPWTEKSGSGMHVHQSLWRDGENIFYKNADELSGDGHAYLAGLLASMTQFALLGSPTPNGFHRRADGSFAPTVVAWATDNRTAAVRAVPGSPGSTRIEHRDGAADGNVYLTIGAQILTGLDGIRSGLEPPAAVTGDAYSQDLPLLPRTFAEAYDNLRDSELAARLLPRGLVDAYLDVLAPELELMMISSSDWERARYSEVPLA